MSHRKYPQVQPTSIRLPNRLRRQLEKHSSREDRYLSVYIVRVLQQEMDRLDRMGGLALPQFDAQENPDGQ